jgi:2-polyprenyl-3-methyl-5-hydroxy-6-metoxy-1,4-benzoquinol methylase
MRRKRSKEKELIDLGENFYSQEEYEQSLKKLFKINKLLGIFKHTVKLLQRFPNNASIADIGCGGGLFILHLSKYFPKMHFQGLDLSEGAINLARNELKQWKGDNVINVEFKLQTQATLTLQEQSVDIILVTLVCHHLDDEELVLFLQQAKKTACNALIINDLQRSYIAYGFYKLFSPLLFRNRLITHDGLISIKKGFTRKELELLLQQANIKNYRIKWRFPFWWNVIALT